MKERPPDPNYFQYSEIQGVVLQSFDPIAHSISADFKLGVGIARSIKRRFQRSNPTKKPLLAKSFCRNGSPNRNVSSMI